MVPELWKSIAGAVARWALTGLGALLVRQGVVEQNAVDALIAGAGVVLAALAWSLYQKYKGRLHFLTALQAPPTSSEADVKEQARTGNWPFWAIPLALALGLTSACGDKDLKAIASNVDRAAILIKDGREITSELHAQKLISNDEALQVSRALYKANTALRAFNNRAQTYKDAGGLTPEGKALLKKLANDIATAATELVSDGTFGIKNPDVQTRINAAIGAIRQVALAIVDAVELLKARPLVQQQGFDPIAAIPLLFLALRQLLEYKARAQARTGKTAEEIFADAGVQIDANDLALLEDMARYAPAGDVPPEIQARIDAMLATLTTDDKSTPPPQGQ